MASLTVENNSATVNQLFVKSSAAAIKALQNHDSISTLTVQPKRSSKTTAKAEAEVEKILDALQKDTCQVTTLNLMYKKIGKLGCEAVSKVLISESCQYLTSLGVLSESIDEGCGAIAAALVNTNCALTCLELNATKNKDIGKEACIHIADALKNVDCKLENLTLACQNIDLNGCKSIASALMDSTASLKNLALKLNLKNHYKKIGKMEVN